MVGTFLYDSFPTYRNASSCFCRRGPRLDTCGIRASSLSPRRPGSSRACANVVARPTGRSAFAGLTLRSGLFL